MENLSTGERRDGMPTARTDIRRTLTAIIASRDPGAEAIYDPAEYLDQQTRALRISELGSPSLWQALTAHTSDPDDLARLAYAAKKRRLYKQGVQLGRKAVIAGHHHAPSELVRLLHISLDPHREGVLWVAAHADLSRPIGIALLLNALRRAHADEAVQALLDRDPVGNADLSNGQDAAMLLDALRSVDAGEAAITVAAGRAVVRVDVTRPIDTAMLLNALRRAHADEAVQTLLDRDPAASADLSNGQDAAMLLDALRSVDAGEAAITVAAGRA
ncbi:hypothetical protein ACWGEU_08260, partial [Streptomyces goshikiensis]